MSSYLSLMYLNMSWDFFFSVTFHSSQAKSWGSFIILFENIFWVRHTLIDTASVNNLFSWYATAKQWWTDQQYRNSPIKSHPLCGKQILKQGTVFRIGFYFLNSGTPLVPGAYESVSWSTWTWSFKGNVIQFNKYLLCTHCMQRHKNENLRKGGLQRRLRKSNARGRRKRYRTEGLMEPKREEGLVNILRCHKGLESWNSRR